MATIDNRKQHVFFMDSRGDGLDAKLKDHRVNEPFLIKIGYGATFSQLVDKADTFLYKYPFHVVYIAGGACDITTKEKGSGNISFDWNPPGKLGPHLVKSLKDADSRLAKNHPASKVVFCTLVGSELRRVVNAHGINDHQQLAVDDAIFEFNTEIFSINKRRGNYSPSLHRTVHRSSKGRRKCYYHHSVDGIHPGKHLKDNWTEEMVKAIGIN